MFKIRGLKPIRSAILGMVGIAIVAMASTAYAKEATPPGIGVREATLGTIFMSADGFSLYTYDNDQPGKSVCVDKCAIAWPPLIAPADARPSDPWSLITRDDGAKQWALDGKPVYTYQKDKLPGTAYGEGVQDVWHLAVALAPRPRDVTYRGTLLGRVAADLKGMTLYTSDKDTATSQACSTSCLRLWMPLNAPEAAIPVGDWSITRRADDGTSQWAYKGKPVYRYANDIKPGDTAGEGAEKTWRAVVMEAFPPTPSWVTVQQSEYGPIFADGQGRTLYYLVMDLAAFEILSCPEDCFRANMKPFLADNGAQAPGGSWTIVENPDGKMQWAYRGELIFTYVGDTSPGDIKGEKFGVGIANGTWQVLQQERMIPPVM